ncbi:mechanosensitive ion channel domain-containing protein [Zavarzinia sp. CC-PAN008]|uniref:mechanosensitive ion channel domain-containing protein n=1 Tax=Zavarzinia sp. CC-PAN008 TaxID=3243332 RepID=UPI003F748B4A
MPDAGAPPAACPDRPWRARHSAAPAATARSALRPGLLALVLGIALWLSLAPGARAQDPAPAPSAQQVAAMVATLEDPAQRQKLIEQLKLLVAAEQAAAPASPQVDLVEDFLTRRWLGLRQGVEELAGAFRDLPSLGAWFERLGNDPAALRELAELVQMTAIVLAVAFIAFWIAGRVMRPVQRPLDQRLATTLGGRLALSGASLILHLVPVAVFLAVGLAASSVLDMTNGARAMVRAVVSGATLVELAVAATVLLFAPDAPGRRLVPVSDETAYYLKVWVRRLSRVAIYGYFATVALAQVGLPARAALALLKIVGLVFTALLVVFVLQNRKGVADWLARPRASTASAATQAQVSAARRRLADAWHILAVIWVVAMYGIWLLDVDGGFALIFRGSVLSVLILVLARVATYGLGILIRRGLSMPSDVTQRLPALENRANRYLSVLARGAGILIWVLALLLVLAAWGVDSFAWAESQAGQTVLSAIGKIVLTVLVALVIWEVSRTAIERALHPGNGSIERSARLRTLLPLMRNVVWVVLVALVLLTVLSQMGVDTAPLLASAGVVGLAVGFGAQTLVKDIITGLFMLLEDTVSIGDVVTVGGLTGTVEGLTLRTIRLRNASGAVYTIPFSNVTSIENKTRDYAYADMDVAVSYDTDLRQAMEAMRLAYDDLKDAQAQDILEPLEIQGVETITGGLVTIRLRIKTRPGRQWAVGRTYRQGLKARCDTMGIGLGVPYARPAKDPPWLDALTDGTA